MNHVKSLIKAVIGATLAWPCFAMGQTTTITFEPGPPAPIVGRIIPSWSEAGFSFSIPNGLSHYNRGPNNPGSPDDGSAYVRFLIGQTDLNIIPTNGTSFAALSVDLAEYSTFFGLPTSITFVGTRSDSSSTSVTFTTDGIIDGPGGAADFERFLFPPTFSELISLRVDKNVYAMDNLTVAPVPERGVSALFTLGIAGAAFCAGRKAWRNIA
jgi:hypothetical protein